MCRYKEPLLNLMEGLLKKMLMDFNLVELKELDDDRLDSDVCMYSMYSMYVCIYVCMYECTVCMYVCMDGWMDVLYIRMYVCTYVYVCTVCMYNVYITVYITVW